MSLLVEGRGFTFYLHASSMDLHFILMQSRRDIAYVCRNLSFMRGITPLIDGVGSDRLGVEDLATVFMKFNVRYSRTIVVFIRF